MAMTAPKKPHKRRRATTRFSLCPRCRMSPMEVTFDGAGCPICGYQEYSDEIHDVRPDSVSHDVRAHTSLVRGLQIATRRK